MGIAVCGTHYVGMGAASYEYSAENYADKTRFLVDGVRAATVASHGSLLSCYWMSTFAVVISLRNQVMESASAKSNATNARTGNHTGNHSMANSTPRNGANQQPPAPEPANPALKSGPTVPTTGPRGVNIATGSRVAPEPQTTSIVPK